MPAPATDNGETLPMSVEEVETSVAMFASQPSPKASPTPSLSSAQRREQYQGVKRAADPKPSGPDAPDTAAVGTTPCEAEGAPGLEDSYIDKLR